jgi:hypothetical protein
MNHGISCRHGGHHVAQKFNTTTLPLSFESEIDRPLVALTKKLAAGRGDSSDEHEVSKQSRTKAITIKHRQGFIEFLLLIRKVDSRI